MGGVSKSSRKFYYNSRFFSTETCLAGIYYCAVSLSVSYSLCPETAPQLVLMPDLEGSLKPSLLKVLDHKMSCLNWVAISHYL